MTLSVLKLCSVKTVLHTNVCPIWATSFSSDWESWTSLTESHFLYQQRFVLTEQNFWLSERVEDGYRTKWRM
jgi:hypothetical protein